MVLRGFFIAVFLLLSLSVYLVGLALSLTIIGAIIGIPIIVSTYVVDAFLIAMLFNSKAHLKRVRCPSCNKKKLIVTDVMETLSCNCGNSFVIETEG